MSVRLERAKRLHEEGEHKKALSELWYAEADSRYRADYLAEILRLAESIRDSADGRTRKEAETLASTVQESLERLTAPPTPEPSRYREGMPVTTGNELPGFEITEYIGEVFGVVVRSRGAFPQIGAQLKAIVGGELKTMTNLLERSRREAVERMVEQAADRGADAVIAMRFDAEAMADQWSEICAYGTAVKVTQRASGGSVS